MANKNPFDQIAVVAPRYSTFDLSFDHKTSLKMGKLVPTLVQECLPGDVWNIKADAMFRMNPMIAPIMHRVDVTFHHFFVPNRILWPDWEKYVTGGETIAGAELPPPHPIMNINDAITPSSLANYIGCPVNDNSAISMQVNAIPFAAYQRIWYEYYRDQNLEPADPITLTSGVQSGPNMAELLTLRDRAWEHDYFTSCLPAAQKGDAVELPLDFGDVTIKYRDGNSGHGPQKIRINATGEIVNQALQMWTSDEGDLTPAGQPNYPLDVDPNGTEYIDGEDLHTVTTINDLRTAWALQQFLEKNMRAGSRYKEALQAHFNVRSSDQRLQRPEYITGSKATIAISEVLQTSSSDETTPQGNMAGHGIAVTSAGNARFRCEEHGFILTILSIVPKTAYYQGLPRFLQKGNGLFTDRTCYAFPDFAQLGEQEVYNSEVYYDGSDNLNDEVFGYIPRYAEYRYNPSRVSGQMATTLDYWHMSRKFSNRPHLNDEFIKSNPTTRIFAVEDEEYDHIVGHIFTYIKARRPLPIYGIPAPLV